MFDSSLVCVGAFTVGAGVFTALAGAFTVGAGVFTVGAGALTVGSGGMTAGSEGMTAGSEGITGEPTPEIFAGAGGAVEVSNVCGVVGLGKGATDSEDEATPGAGTIGAHAVGAGINLHANSRIPIPLTMDSGDEDGVPGEIGGTVFSNTVCPGFGSGGGNTHKFVEVLCCPSGQGAGTGPIIHALVPNHVPPLARHCSSYVPCGGVAGVVTGAHHVPFQAVLGPHVVGITGAGVAGVPGEAGDVAVGEVVVVVGEIVAGAHHVPFQAVFGPHPAPAVAPPGMTPRNSPASTVTMPQLRVLMLPE